MIYSYKHGFQGFAALLTDDQAATLRGKPGVLKVFPSRVLKTQTTRTWDFLGLDDASLSRFSPRNSSASETAMRAESETIIGLIDTGIWPESASFKDDDMPPVPSRWNGTCQTGEDFTSASCNRKLVGARYYTKGLLANQEPDTVGWIWGYKSARDATGHGTHTASIATGRVVQNVSYRGLAHGSARGGAPNARLAVYKACWEGQCYEEDLLAAIDDAILDGVDVLSLSVAPSPPQPTYAEDALAIGAFHAMQQGLLVICSAGNINGEATVTNAAPWILTVGASSIDRTFYTPIILGNNVTIEGVALNFVASQKFASLVDGGDANSASFTSDQAGACLNYSLDPTKVKGKIVVCKHPIGSVFTKEDKCDVVKEVGGAGVIFIDEFDKSVASTFTLPTAVVSSSDGEKILSYINSTRWFLISFVQALSNWILIFLRL
ncbi:hypothetical protein Mapa_008939 [Marchantia paleacea]|nr:hypothetical protein Mapa_008939 [Marchantia paleacea]